LSNIEKTANLVNGSSKNENLEEISGCMKKIAIVSGFSWWEKLDIE